MNRKQFCEEIINQINFYLGERGSMELTKITKERVMHLILTLISYSINQEEFNKYTLKIKNKIGYLSLCSSYILNLFED